MEKIGTIYQIVSPSLSENNQYFERKYFERVMHENGFRLVRSTATDRIMVCDGGDILDNERTKVAEIEGNNLYLFEHSRTKRLEDFLEGYEK